MSVKCSFKGGHIYCSKHHVMLCQRCLLTCFSGDLTSIWIVTVAIAVRGLASLAPLRTAKLVHSTQSPCPLCFHLPLDYFGTVIKNSVLRLSFDQILVCDFQKLFSLFILNPFRQHLIQSVNFESIQTASPFC